MFMSNKIDLKPKIVTGNKDGHYISGSILQEDIIIRKIYSLNIGESKYISKHYQSEGRNRKQYHNSKGYQYPTFNNG